ncbi:extracellular matrix organizing protein FRAS1-like [Ischnura elegans]|uniref:extracellular matrix organizing protein FRAS1-like n=1 Tax=Ischnura elegans TaxID=197161 RepID=UPI001ED8AC89|nr:extracellular matrix organizing protein FRAS1-like [Ischnura elegans]
MATLLLFLVLLSSASSLSRNSTRQVPAGQEVSPKTHRNPSGGCHDITGKIMPNGWVWQRDPCVRCVCRQGKIGCLSIKCSPTKKCAHGERLDRKLTECCSTCVPKEGTCKHGGKLHESGSSWTPMRSNEKCTCENGTTTCATAEDERNKFSDPNDVLADEPQDSSLTSEAGFLLTVIAGQPETISTHHLSFNMAEAEARQIVFMIARKLRAPQEGRLIIVGMHHAEVTSFTQEDLVDKKLVYVPPHPEDVPSESVFCFPFSVWKYPERSRLTREHSFCVKVLPKPESEMSFSMKNPQFNVSLGGSLEITKRQLEVESAGKHLRYIIIDPPMHGSLKFRSGSSSSKDITMGFEFGVSELADSSMLYAHDGLNNSTDAIEILATDGWGEATNLYIINVQSASTSDNTISRQPQPLVILEGEQVRIQSSFLTPAPTADGRIPRGFYTLTSMPSYGKMILADAEEGEFPLGAHFAFSSQDVEDGKLLYRAADEIGLESRTERLTFNFDTGGSEREQKVRLEISVLPVDDQPPNVAVNGEVVVGEGSLETLPPSLITVTDVDTPMQNLMVEISKQPYFGRITVDRGGPHNIPVESFSVEEFLKGKVSYEQSYSKQVEPIEDVLLFRVTDGVQSSSLSRLNISIDLQNDEPPRIITNTLHVESGRTKLIGKEIVHIEDADTDPASLLVTITQPPTQGVLRKRDFQWRPLGSGQQLSTNDTLVYKDILQGLVSYSAVGGIKDKDDIVALTVTDGTFHDRGKIVIEITNTNTELYAQPSELRQPTEVVTTAVRTTPKHTSPSPTSVRGSRSKEATEQPTTAHAKVLPTRPVILFTSQSWSHHGGAQRDRPGPGPGRPLLCVPPCHPRHPAYAATRGLCKGLDPEKVRYGWEVSVPVDSLRDTYLPFESLEESTAFASTKANLLDPLYVPKRSRVLCIARLPGGTPVKSEYVTVDGPNICDPGDETRGGRGFSAKLSYVDASSRDGHGNTLKVELSIPHSDGMVPLVSTHPLSDPDLLLTDPMYRAHHLCSNLIPGRSFLANRGSRSGRWRMYDDLKEQDEPAIRIYEYLDLDACTWHFEAWFTVAELLEECGGKMISDLRGSKEGKRHIKFKVPLYVSYVLTSSPSKWTTAEHETDMEFSMEYSPLLWKQGIHTKPRMSARLQLKRIAVDDAGRLTLDFTTATLFRGRFALLDLESRPSRRSTVLPPPHLRPSINLTLELLNTDDRGAAEGTEQSWRATSDMALEDYSGEYLARLLPCSLDTAAAPRSGPRPSCTVGPHVDIPMTVNFRQIGKPEPITYSLETEFLLSKRPPELHFGENDHGMDVQSTQPADEMYSPGDEVYGVVMWHPSQDLSSAYKLSIQRLYLCSGKDGYVPVYDPTGEIYGKGPQYGCIQPSRNLEHRFLLMDKFGSQNINRNYHGIPLEVHPASEITGLQSILNHTGVDGFAMKVDPLYRIKSGNQWYIQVLYSIGPSRTRSKRSNEAKYPVEYPNAVVKPLILRWPAEMLQGADRPEVNTWRIAGIVSLAILLMVVVMKVGSTVGPLVTSSSRRIKAFRTINRQCTASEQTEPLKGDSGGELAT